MAAAMATALMLLRRILDPNATPGDFVDGGNGFVSAFAPEFDALLGSIPALACRRADVADLGASTLGHLAAWVATVAPPFDDYLAWMYQYLKQDRERAAFAHSLTPGAQMPMGDVLPTTQFFTEAYMVRHLVDRALEGAAVGPGEDWRLIDPACGGGNFLQYALAVLAERRPGPDGEAHLRELLEHTLVGYELDRDLAEIACLGLFLKAAQLGGRPRHVRFAVYTALSPADVHGALPLADAAAPKLMRACDGAEVDYADVLGARRYAAVVTNPPFMGPRTMPDDLRRYLKARFPGSRGDLCVAFFARCLELARPGARVGLVVQTGWMFLHTLKPWRDHLLATYRLNEVVDLGAGAFTDLNGEKATVALVSLELAPPGASATLLALASLPRKDKPAVLKHGAIPPERRLEGPQARLFGGADVGFDRRTALPPYASVATPMQGTSTGDNARFIDFYWRHVGDPDWVPVSKGGGYCKWSGLDQYVVRWGPDAAHVRAQPGSALRNLQHMAGTALVFSDTGTLGMSVRLLRPGQVFIASGPGIRVHAGDAFAHLAFLNSRLASHLLRRLTPKLTIAAGYIARLPLADGLVTDPSLAEWARACVAAKDRTAGRKLANPLYQPADFGSYDDWNDAVSAAISADLQDELARLELEGRIEAHVRDAFGLTPAERADLERECGNPAAWYPDRTPDLSADALDAELASMLDAAARFAVSKRRRFGTEGVLEELAVRYACAPAAIARLIQKRLPDLVRLRALYRDDFIHRATLHAIGLLPGQSTASESALPINELSARLLAAVPALASLSPDQWLTHTLPDLHARAFYGAPLLARGQARVAELAATR